MIALQVFGKDAFRFRKGEVLLEGLVGGVLLLL